MTVLRSRAALLLPFAAAAAALAQAPATAPIPTVITSDHLDIQSAPAETTSYFTGHVVVTGTNLILHCDHLTVVTTRVSDQTAAIGQPSAFKSLVATGHVDIRQSQGAREATCGRAQVFPGQDRIVLTENPVVTDHGNGSVATGEEIDMYRGQRRVDGIHVRLTMPPVKDLGFDRNQKPPGPAAPASSNPGP